MQQAIAPADTTTPNAEITLEAVLTAAQQLSPADKAQLISEIATSMKKALIAPAPERPPQFIGIWAGLDLTDEDIAEARREMWGNFPREDV